MGAVPGAAPMAASHDHDVADGHGSPNPERDELVGVREFAEPGEHQGGRCQSERGCGHVFRPADIGEQPDRGGSVAPGAITASRMFRRT